MRPIRVYDGRSWAVIGVMTAAAVALNQGWIPLSTLARGGVNLAIGSALINLGAVSAANLAKDGALAVDIRGTKLNLQLVKPPFVELKKAP